MINNMINNSDDVVKFRFGLNATQAQIKEPLKEFATAEPSKELKVKN